jgi:hypothetical protein
MDYLEPNLSPNMLEKFRNVFRVPRDLFLEYLAATREARNPDGSPLFRDHNPSGNKWERRSTPLSLLILSTLRMLAVGLTFPTALVGSTA